METMARLMAVQPCNDVLKITFILWKIFDYKAIRKYNRETATREGCNLSSNALRNIDREWFSSKKLQMVNKKNDAKIISSKNNY